MTRFPGDKGTGIVLALVQSAGICSDLPFQHFTQAKRAGYQIMLYYLWLPNPRLAARRVRERVRKGGHDVPAGDIRRRFLRSLTNLATRYLALADEWAIFDNSGRSARLVAKSVGGRLTVLDTVVYDSIAKMKQDL